MSDKGCGFSVYRVWFHPFCGSALWRWRFYSIQRTRWRKYLRREVRRWKVSHMIFFWILRVGDPSLNSPFFVISAALISNMKVLCTCPWPMLDPIPSKCIETNLSMSRSSSFPCRGAHVPIFVLLRVPVRTYLTILPVDRSSSSRLWKLLGWTDATLFLARYWREKSLSRRLKPRGQVVALQRARWPLWTLESCKDFFLCWTTMWLAIEWPRITCSSLPSNYHT